MMRSPETTPQQRQNSTTWISPPSAEECCIGHVSTEPFLHIVVLPPDIVNQTTLRPIRNGLVSFLIITGCFSTYQVVGHKRQPPLFPLEPDWRSAHCSYRYAGITNSNIRPVTAHFVCTDKQSTYYTTRDCVLRSSQSADRIPSLWILYCAHTPLSPTLIVSVHLSSLQVSKSSTPFQGLHQVTESIRCSGSV